MSKRPAFLGKTVKTSFPLVFIAFLGLFVYSNTLNVPFQWDEPIALTDNPIVKDLGYFSDPSLAKGFRPYYYSFRDRYMGYLSFAFNYKVHGLDVRGYHVVNIVLHILNSLLVYALIRLTLRTPALTPPFPPLGKGGTNGGVFAQYIPLFVSLILVSHPIQTEAVTYIMGRLPLLMWFFYFSSMVLYARWRLTPLSSPHNLRGDRGGSLYLLSLLSAVLAMKTKENALTLPLSIAMYEFLFFNPSRPPLTLRGGEGGVIRRGRRLLYLAPFMLTLLIIPLSLMSFERPVGEVIGDIESASRHYTETPRMSYFFTQFRVLVTYLRLLFLPVNQNFDYDYPVYNSFFNPQVFLSFLFLLSIFSLGIFFLIRSKRGNPSVRLLSWGIFWFFLTLSVESSIFPIPMLISEYRLYAPSMGIILAVVSALFISGRRPIIPALIAITLVFSFASYARNSVWKGKITLWEDVVGKSPGKARAHNNLGLAYAERGRGEEAIAHYEKALTLDPSNVEGHVNIGNLYKGRGWNDKAIEHYNAALKIIPGYAEAHYNLGVTYAGMGDIDKVIEHSFAAIRLNPGYAEAHSNLGTAFWHRGLYDRAIEHYRISLGLKPGDAVVHYNLGKAYESKGLVDEAKMEFEKAKELTAAKSRLGR